MKAFWGDPDNGEDCVVDAKRRSDGRRLGVVMVLPIRVANDHYGMSVLRVVAFRSGEESSCLRSYAQHVEEVARDHLAPHTRCVGAVAHCEYVTDARCYLADQPQTIAKISEVEIGRSERLAIGSKILNRHNTLGLHRPGYRVQHHGPDPGKDSCVCADPDSDRQHSYSGEAGISQQRPHPVAEVAQ